MQKEHIIKCKGFSTAYDICSILDSFDTITFTVTTIWNTTDNGCGFVEYEIRYYYQIEGDD